MLFLEPPYILIPSGIRFLDGILFCKTFHRVHFYSVTCHTGSYKPLNQEDYHKKELVLSAGKMNLYSLLLLIPVFLVFYLPFYLIWDQGIHLAGFRMIIREHGLLFFGILVLGIFLHELIHGITWARYCRNGFHSILFGFSWKSFSPYCHCREILKINHYLAGTLMPGLVTGVLPALAGIISGNLMILILGIIFTMAAGGDFIFLWMLRNVPGTAYAEDHPEKAGCYLYLPKTN